MRLSVLLAIVTALGFAGCGGTGGGNQGPSDLVVLRANLEDPGAYALYQCGPDGQGFHRLSGALGSLYGVNAFVWSPDRARIAFTDDKVVGNEPDVYVVGAEGGDPVKVTGPHVAGQGISDVVWSPDSQSLLIYGDLAGDGHYRLHVAPAAGGTPVQVSGPDDLVYYASWAWSPDSTKVVYQATTIQAGPNGPLAEFVVHADATARTNVSGAMVAGGSVRALQIGVGESPWSPDSSRVAFIADKQVDERFELFTVFPDGTGLVKVLAAPAAGDRVWSFQWSPDASRIAGLRQNDAANPPLESRLWTTTPVGGGLVAVSAPGEFAYTYSWKPDGTAVAYTSNSVDLRTAPAAGGASTLLAHVATPGQRIEPFTWRWSPDGSQIGYLAGKVDPANTDELRLFSVVGTGVDAPALLSPQVLEGDGNVDAFTWSPDSSRVLFRAQVTAGAPEELFLALADGSSTTQVSAAEAAGRPLGGWTWSTDGARYAYQEGYDVGQCVLLTADRDGGDVGTALDSTPAFADLGQFQLK